MFDLTTFCDYWKIREAFEAQIVLSAIIFCAGKYVELHKILERIVWSMLS